MKYAGRKRGNVTDAELKKLKKKAHAAFDPLWQRGKFFGRRDEAYRWLSERMGLPKEMTHIGMFNAGQCLEVIRIAKIERSKENV